MTDGADLQIHLLGDLKLLSRGRALVLPPSKKTRALLAFLVTTGRPHLRESLCDLLWEGPDDPRGALRWSLAKLRPLLDGEHATRLVTDREWVALRRFVQTWTSCGSPRLRHMAFPGQQP